MTPRFKKIWISVLSVVIPLLIIGAASLAVVLYSDDDHQHSDKSSQHHESHEKKEHKQEKASKLWGIDTVNEVTQPFLKCVNDHFGKPDVVARYLTGKKGAYKGLTSQEIKLLHKNKLSVLPIYNQFTNATGKDNGAKEAKRAIQAAKNLKVPKETLIIADIEPKYPVDKQFIIAWTKTIVDAHYKPGIYGNFGHDNLKGVYKQAQKSDKQVKKQLVLWTNTPSKGTSTKKKAPKSFEGASPNSAQTIGWQYGIEAKHCNIDTNIFKGQIQSDLW
ncbi:hypothetical protein GCM10011391_38040 [Pullulanibacillus camelliae]|uniref:Rv2525c-like glycoside hydrolase-like domain-containing protein n=1 Tax=Pullulanibacillus camelliae TaxID=1707096 RepID=A0A8J3E1Y6_9BACL|nr:glycoside hydrolase domain-containing protein [Pullulanibacillus camelliae]GGE55429.1 hypothetical protein GCM10011391_38040 [Pullulanibacillus camelliae]